jgi:uncharacterized membrane protein YdjX (TVP38/TMEM64 family)
MNDSGTRQAKVRRWGRLSIAVIAWAALVAGWFAVQRRSGLGSIDTAQRLIDAARGNWWAVVAYLGVSLVRPLVLFPATVVTVAAGLLFGPVAGVAVAVVAANASALVGYSIGRRLSRPTDSAQVTSRLGEWASRIRANGFEAVLLTRLIFLPYDLVNYGSGLLRVRPASFLAATAIGSLPGTVAFVLVGASITRLDDGFGGVDPVTLAASVLLIVASIAVSRVVKRRQPGAGGAARALPVGDE